MPVVPTPRRPRPAAADGTPSSPAQDGAGIAGSWTVAGVCQPWHTARQSPDPGAEQAARAMSTGELCQLLAAVNTCAAQAAFSAWKAGVHHHHAYEQLHAAGKAWRHLAHAVIAELSCRPDGPGWPDGSPDWPHGKAARPHR